MLLPSLLHKYIKHPKPWDYSDISKEETENMVHLHISRIYCLVIGIIYS